MVKNINIGNAPVLRTKAVPVVPILNEDSLTQHIVSENQQKWPAEIIELVTNLKETAESLGSDCAGLASNQIWDKETPPPAVFVVQIGRNYLEMINPKIVTSGKTLKIEEGCFSRPGIKKKMRREANVTVTFQTITDTEPKAYKIFSKDSFAAIAIQHEYDHLLGKLI